MAAFASAFLPKVRWASCALLTAGLTACGSPQPVRIVLAEHCFDVSAAAPLILPIASPGGGILRITVRQRGISLAVALGADAASAESISPVDRYGTIMLIAESRQRTSHTLRVNSRDSAAIKGDACVSADLLDESDRADLAAARAFADAGRFAQARSWQRAFDDYLLAARSWDHSDRQRAAESRHAMARLAYQELGRNRDAYVLATRALTDFGPRADAGLRSALLGLEATSLVESTEETPKMRHAQVLGLLAAGRALALNARFGERELPRLEILQGFFEYSMDNASGARALFETAAAHCKALQDWECFARALQNFAVLAEDTGNNQAAVQAYADALQFLSPAVAPELTADIWDNLGRLQGSSGSFSRAEQSYLKAAHLYAMIDECDGVRRILARLGTLLVDVGSVGDAADYLARAASLTCPALLASARRAPAENNADRAAAARAANAPSTPEVTRASCTAPVEVNDLTGDGKFAVFHALLALSEAASLEGRTAAAAECVKRAGAYTTSSRTQLRLANATGRVLVEEDRAAAARVSFARALAIAEQAHMATTNEHRPRSFLGLAEAALLEGQLGTARQDAAESLRLSGARADISQVTAALHMLARVLRASGDAGAAVRTLKASANLIEQVPIDELDAEKRTTYLASQHGVFAELTDLLIAAAQAPAATADPAAAWEAFDAAERGHARSLRYALSQTRDDDARLPRAGAATQYQALLKPLAALAAAHGAGGEVVAAIEPLDAPAPEESRVAGIERAPLTAQLAHSQAALIEYAAGRDDMYAFVIEGAEIHIVQLGNLKRIAAAAADLFEHLRDPEVAAADVRRAGQRLAALALWPVTRLVTRERAIFVPDDSLYTVPFALLPWSDARDSPLVVQHAEVSLAPSALFLLQHPQLRAARDAAVRFELIGAPVFGLENWQRECLGRPSVPGAPLIKDPRGAADSTPSLPRLPGARRELSAIAALARSARPQAQVSLRLGCMATPNALRQAAATQPQLLHIATHGYVDALRPRLSALALSRDTAGDAAGGVFGLLDILDLKINARLVVLSACDTSRGRLLPGEGVLAPAQAFLQAGAASVLASYWRIDDAATAAFMQNFYKHLLTERLAVAAALRNAQLDELAAGGPHTWAAFALYGWPDSSL
jgi:CHAT domain-containing protein